ncbi:tannase and feruloyl esterase [Rhizodiscina lignyota]|uniref:Carboxylic ester hydrolase n=1 Tax=Rhizodiscina lignyota TaxID=1504668 RepID=A0A9P4M375_9PEZI|nr:tannase and feruloyl esterase [Rhizodiscina lignyota]
MDFGFPVRSLLIILTSFPFAFSYGVPPSPCASLPQAAHHLGFSKHIQYDSSSLEVGTLNLTGVTGTNNYSLCRVIGTIAYGTKYNNTLNFELWLPDSSNYNGRYLSIGNGGFAGTIDYETMMTNLNGGYAVGGHVPIGCDSGHPVTSNDPSMPGGYVEFLNNRDETLVWIQDSIAMFTGPAKELTTTYYSKAPKKMYYFGCSTGGAQGFALAQLHPDIFDGIYAGSPGNYYSHLILSFLWNGLNSNSTESFLSQDALNFITNAVVKKCDTIDGVQDGIIDDPRKCDFDISALACSGHQKSIVNNATVCLTAPQIANARKFYSGPKNPKTGESIYPGFVLGSETEWLQQETSLYLQYGVPILQNFVFKNLNYDYTKFNWGSDVDAVDRTATPLISEISPDLHAFKKHGGKMIVTQGWADPYNAPGWPIQQRNEMHGIFGNELADFYSLFMVPGGGHCGGASNYPQMPGTYNLLSERLVPWVENGAIPEDIMASNPADGSNSTRKLCPYPQEAKYEKGDINDWMSYICI